MLPNPHPLQPTSSTVIFYFSGILGALVLVLLPVNPFCSLVRLGLFLYISHRTVMISWHLTHLKRTSMDLGEKYCNRMWYCGSTLCVIGHLCITFTYASPCNILPIHRGWLCSHSAANYKETILNNINSLTIFPKQIFGYV